MTNFLGGAKKASQPNPPATQMRIQSSIQGSVIPIGWGQARIAPNLLYYNDFTATAVQDSQAGGKGSGGGSSGKAGGGSGQYNYAATVIAGLCEGPVAEVYTLFNGKANIAAYELNFVLFNGGYTQTAWNYLAVWHPGDARAYRGIAYLAAAPIALGTSPEMPNISIEVLFIINTALPNQPTNSSFAGEGAGSPGWGGASQVGNALPDANPADILIDFCTNPYYGLGFPSARIGDSSLATLRTYCRATGLVMSPALTQQRPANSFLQDVLYGCVAEAVWSGGQIKVVPYWDTVVTGNGATFSPSLSPVYSLGDDDFIAGGSGSNNYQSALIVTRKALADRYNDIKIQYLDRNNLYNPTIVEAKDDAAIQAWTLRARDTKQLDLFCWAPAAQLCANLQLGREQVVATCQFTVGPRYVLLEPMDLVAVSDTALGLTDQLVRIKEITENEDFSLTIVAEDALIGHASAPRYGQQVNTASPYNYNVDPGLTNAPVFFEPTDQLAGGLAVILAACPVSLTHWGGCNVYVSYDAQSYQYVGQMLGPSRMGVLTAPLPAVTASTTPPTIDYASTLAVDLSQSGAQLTSGTFNDLKAFASLCFVGGELLAYESATPTGANAYALTTLNRGGYGTSPVAAPAGTAFVRLDAGVLRIPFTQDRIGQTLYVKLVSFNKYGSGPQSLASVSPYTYVIQGTALASPLPTVTNFTSVYSANVSQLTWTEVTDFRPILYEVRKGSSWSAGAILGRFAHPPVPTFGDDTYWISAYSQPLAGLQVYSSAPTELVLSGSILPANLMRTWNEFAGTTTLTGPSGSYGGTAFWDGTFIQNSGSGDLLAATDVTAIADVFNDGTLGNGTYQVPATHEIDLGRVAACLVGIDWTFAGALASNNVFAYSPFFAVTDFFGAVSNQLVNVYPEIALSQDGVTWGPWQRYCAGTYSFRRIRARIQIQTTDPSVYAYLTSFFFTVWAPTRIDHFVNQTILAGGHSFTFVPDGTTTAAPFNGGPNNAVVPSVLVTILAAQPGDIAQVTNLTPSGCTVNILNNGISVQRSCNISVEGY